MRAAVGFCLLLSSCVALQNNSYLPYAHRLAAAHGHVYRLPFAEGRGSVVAQGYRSLFSHWGDCAIDFKMPIGTPVVAARGGVVVYTRHDDSTHGIGRRNVGTGNGLTIRHADGTFAHYWHLRRNGVLVAVGDSVTEGQPIAFSGNTGFTAFPHLHFEVTRTLVKGGQEVPVLFRTERGPQMLKPLKRYRVP